MTRYKFLQDDDGHDYLVPVDKEQAFRVWLEAAPYWENYGGEDFSEYRTACHPNCYTFENPELKHY